MACKCCKETAPYKQYKHTDTSMFQDGVESGRAWRSHWNHLPGGPWVPKVDRYNLTNSCEDWLEYCETLKRHNQIWLDGWRAGMKAHHPEQLQRIVSKTVYDKVAA